MPAESLSASEYCYHCGLEVMESGKFTWDSTGGRLEFCCPGCMAITQTIQLAGLNHYYKQRESSGVRPELQDLNDQNGLLENVALDQFRQYDHPAVQRDWIYCVDKDRDLVEGVFLVEGISCAACVWLIERYLSRYSDITQASVNYTTNQLKVRWCVKDKKVSEILFAISQIGYQARPFTVQARQQALQKERKAMLKRLGLSAALGMQVMVLSVALYGGGWFGIEIGLADFLRKTCLLLTLPVVAYSARPFFEGAARSLRGGSPGMDIPVTTGILLAFSGSIWATIKGQGDIYFDSVVMFVFFLLGARYLELSARIRGTRILDALADSIPATCFRIREDGNQSRIEIIAVSELKKGEIVMVNPGEIIPVDGMIVEGHSSIDESLLTGESYPVVRGVGDTVIAGAINMEQSLMVRMTRSSKDSMLLSIKNLAETVKLKKPRLTLLADNLSVWFVSVVLFLALTSAVLGLWSGDINWLSRTIAILVVTCPCAFSLATPLALSAGANGLIGRGVYVLRQHALETLAKVDHLVFDKTGTLTRGELTLSGVFPLMDQKTETSVERILKIAASLEVRSKHPIAKSILNRYEGEKLFTVTESENRVGGGVVGMIEGKKYALGSFKFVSEVRSQGVPLAFDLNNYCRPDEVAVVLCADGESLAVLTFTDQLKYGAGKLIAGLQGLELTAWLLTGDRKEVAKEVSAKLDIEKVIAECSPGEKVEVIRELANQGKVVAMVGDGLNDYPALNQSHLSIAVSKDINLTTAHADVVVLSKDISVVEFSIKQARCTLRIIRQNIIWAISYNAITLPLAVAGYLPPWLAAIGMSLSSVVVVLNSSRLLYPKSVKSINKEWKLSTC